jgi:hypothetical protein
MPATKSECLCYIKADVEIFFPENRVCCRYCPLLETYARAQCRRTGEYIVDQDMIGHFCPLMIEKENDHETI